MSSAPELPPFRVIAAALRTTTEHLTRELRDPAPHAPSWSDFEWRVAMAAASVQGLSTLLANRLRWGGPTTWRRFLDEQRERSIDRQRVIDTSIQRIGGALNAAQLAAVGLKGTALRQLDLYQPGERPMGDVDLLVRGQDLGAIGTALRDIGYVLLYTSERHATYMPAAPAATVAFGEHPANALSIEVHQTIAERLPVHRVDITDRVLPALQRPGLAGYPDSGALMCHLLLHAAGNMRQHALRFIQLCDIARLAPLLERADWHANAFWWAYPPLALTERSFPGSIPTDVLESAAAQCRGTLRRSARRWCVSDVSWSNLRAHAVPGIRWARSPLEALRFFLSRALPSRQAHAMLECAVEAQPHLKDVPWYTLSQTQRILRWAVSRPPRVQTLLSVRAACALRD